jgi:hypothetical protein
LPPSRVVRHLLLVPLLLYLIDMHLAILGAVLQSATSLFVILFNFIPISLSSLESLFDFNYAL